jgi:hypothetical protein
MILASLDAATWAALAAWVLVLVTVKGTCAVATPLHVERETPDPR